LLCNLGTLFRAHSTSSGPPWQQHCSSRSSSARHWLDPDGGRDIRRSPDHPACTTTVWQPLRLYRLGDRQVAVPAVIGALPVAWHGRSVPCSRKACR